MPLAASTCVHTWPTHQLLQSSSPQTSVLIFLQKKTINRGTVTSRDLGERYRRLPYVGMACLPVKVLSSAYIIIGTAVLTQHLLPTPHLAFHSHFRRRPVLPRLSAKLCGGSDDRSDGQQVGAAALTGLLTEMSGILCVHCFGRPCQKRCDSGAEGGSIRRNCV